MFSIPPSASASASPSLAQHTPTAPAAIWRRAMSTLLCVLAWGRRATPARRANAAMAAMLRSNASTSTIRAGVLSAAPGALLADRAAGGGRDLQAAS